MAFEDRFPFRDREPSAIGEHSVTPSTPAEGLPARASAFKDRLPIGTTGQYRLVLRGMRVPGLADELCVGRVVLHQTDGPVWTQRTHVVQAPGWRPTYTKAMDRGPVEVADGYRLTIALLDVRLPDDLASAFRLWRDECMAAVAFLVSVLDERVAQEVLAEDLVLDDVRGEPRAVADITTQVREFTPTERVLKRDLPALNALASLDPAAESPINAAARWYLRAVQGGVRPDAIVFFWIALEALSKPPFGTKLTKEQRKISDVGWVEKATAAAGIDPSGLQVSIGKLAGLRAQIVHGGIEAPALLRDGHYTLEMIVRAVLRHAIELPASGWPLRPGESRLRGPLAWLLARVGKPRTVWRDRSSE